MLLRPKSTKNKFLAVLLTKLYTLMIHLASQFFTEEKNAVNKSLKQFFKKMNIAKIC